MDYPAEVFGIVSALYWKHMDLAFGSTDDVHALTAKMAEQIANEVSRGWSADGDLLIHQNQTEVYSLQWRDPDGQILYPMVRRDLVIEKVREEAQPFNHLEPEQPDFTSPESGDQTRLENGLIMVIKQVGTMYAALDQMKKEVERLRHLKYTARLNFKQVTFHPVEDGEK